MTFTFLNTRSFNLFSFFTPKIFKIYMVKSLRVFLFLNKSTKIYIFFFDDHIFNVLILFCLNFMYIMCWLCKKKLYCTTLMKKKKLLHFVFAICQRLSLMYKYYLYTSQSKVCFGFISKLNLKINLISFCLLFAMFEWSHEHIRC